MSFKFHVDRNTAYKDDVRSGRHQFWGIVGYEIVLSVCLYVSVVVALTTGGLPGCCLEALV